MSRVYSVMTGTGAVRGVIEEPHDDVREDEFIIEAEDAPFIEIGGPAGAVFSPASTKPAVEAKTKSDAARSYPRIVAPIPAPTTPDTTKYLSIHFHDVLPRGAGRIADGPDAGLVAFYFPDHAVCGEYRTLRDEITRQLTQVTTRALTFTSAASEAGTTTVLLNLGITLARDGQRVLVLDTNASRPGVAAKLALPSSPGLAEVLDSHVPLSWAIQPTAVPGLQALTVGSTNDAAALERAIGRDLPKLVGQLRQWFDWILIDAGVWGISPERDATCSTADAVYLVTREGDADRPEFTGLRTWVKQLGGALRGYVTTRI